VAIGRAIVRKPRVFLFDEPLSNLDAALRVQTRVEIAKLHRDLGSASMIYVTHDQVEAMTLADKIVLLQPLAGRDDMLSVAQVGHPLELYHHPANRFVAGFIGSPAMNFIECRVAGVADGRVTAKVSQLACEAALSPAGLVEGEPVTLGIRPEHVVVGEGNQRARVSHVEHLGEQSYVYLDVQGVSTPLLAKTHRDDIEINDDLPFMLPPQAMHMFRADGVAQARPR
jgi:multiple sugar transport system ATP-binding protein